MRSAILYCTIILTSAIVASAAEFRFEEREQKYLDLYEGEKPVLTYNFGIIESENAPSHRARSSYAHPIYSVDGIVLTDDFPRDHYHHRGIFLAWQQVLWKGKNYDPWTLRGGMYTRFDQWMERETKGDSATFTVQNGWYVEDERLVDEKVRWIVYPATGTARVIDIQILLQAVNEDVILRGEVTKGYGGFGVRYAPRRDEQITTSAGLHSQDAVMLHTRWCDYSGKFRGEDHFSGIAVFTSPSHPDFPPAWIMRHYGYLGLCWPGLKDHVLKAGDEPLELNYRVYIHEGDAKEGKVREAYEEYRKAIDE